MVVAMGEKPKPIKIATYPWVAVRWIESILKYEEGHLYIREDAPRILYVYRGERLVFDLDTKKVKLIVEGR